MAKRTATKPKAKPSVSRKTAPPAKSPKPAAADPQVAAPPTATELLVLALAREQAEALDVYDKLDREFQAKKTAALEAKHARQEAQDKLNDITRAIREAERTGRCDRQPRLFDRQEEQERIERAQQLLDKEQKAAGAARSNGHGSGVAAEEKPATRIDITSHTVSVLDIPVPWVETMEKKGVKSIGQLAAKVAANASPKAMGFSRTYWDELCEKLEAYQKKHAATEPTSPGPADETGDGGSLKTGSIDVTDLPADCKHKLTLLYEKASAGYRVGWDYSLSYGSKNHVTRQPSENQQTFVALQDGIEWAAKQVLHEWTHSGDSTKAKDKAIAALKVWIEGAGDAEPLGADEPPAVEAAE